MTVWESTPLQPPVPIQEAEVVVPVIAPTPVEAPKEGEWKGLAVRAESDMVFVLKGGKRYWMTSPEDLAKWGFKLGEEVKIDRETLILIPEGEPIR
jgi:hypothetical protein